MFCRQLLLCPTAGGVPSGGVRSQRPYPPIRTLNASETAGLSRNPPHWVHPLLGAVVIFLLAKES